MTRQQPQPVTFTRGSVAGAVAFALLGGPVAHAGIVTLGDVSPDPSSGTVVGALQVGPTNPGTLTVNGGSRLDTDILWVANTRVPRGGNGQVNVTGAGSLINVTWANGGNFDLGGSGMGSMLLSDGGRVQYGPNTGSCALSCALFVGNAAGSTGSLTITGAGSMLDTASRVIIGQASVFREAAGDTLDYGEVGGHGSGSATLTNGGQARSSLLRIGVPGGGTTARNGQESATGSVVVDGIGSLWNVVRSAALTGAQALLGMATGANTTATLDVRNGGVVKLDGLASPGDQSGFNMGVAAGGVTSNSRATVNVQGSGSRLEMASGTGGFINVGRGTGSTATLNVTQGGVVEGTSPSGLAFISVGRGGGDGTLNVQGSGSLFRLSGTDSVGSGAFMNVGRLDAGVAGTGRVTVGQGARLEIDDSNPVLTSNNQTGMQIGIGAGSSGQLTITGAGSELAISGGSGKTPYIGVGRDGATGQVSVLNGGKLSIASQHVSAASPGANYAVGQAVFLEIGRRTFGSDGLPSTGSVLVSGAGSELRMSGSADRLLVVGSGAGGDGTLSINQGGKVITTGLLVGNGLGATGSLNMNGGILQLEGSRQGGPAPNPGGAGMSIGRAGGGVGTAVITNGSTVTIDTTGPAGGMTVGGSSVAPGGTGTLLLSGGSTITINGPQSSAAIGGQGTPDAHSVGSMVMSGAGTSMAVQGAGARVLVANHVNSTGTLVVGAGTVMSTSGLIGVGHDGTLSTGGIGTLVVNGSASANALFIGSGGLLGGSGMVNANVSNQGLVNPGNSPGRLTVNGGFDNTGGTLVLEIQSLGNSLFAIDELVFGDIDNVLMGDGSVRFVFLGDTDPLAFMASGQLDLGNFFKERDGGGAVNSLDDSRLGLFSEVKFSATSDRFVVTNLQFDPVTGQGSLRASAVPLPGTAWLVLAAWGVMAVRRRRSH
ncbi:MAG: hypothetical protein RJA10_1549 [Pseudomonadota bacterium]